MPEPQRLPVRVLIKGASTTIYTSWMSGPRSDFTWPRVVESELVAAGWPNEIHCTAVPAELTRSAFQTWHVEVLAWSPDVVILDYGRMECVHLLLPKWLERHANSLAVRPFPVRQFYRRHLMRPLWKGLARAQQAADNRLPVTSPLSTWRVRRGIKDIEGILKRIQTVASPLILIPEIPPFGRVYQGWFPKANERVDMMNVLIADLAKKIDSPQVVFVPMAHVWEPTLAKGEDACPDGGHFTPEMHRAFGEELGRVVLEWTEKQPHLLVEARDD